MRFRLSCAVGMAAAVLASMASQADAQSRQQSWQGFYLGLHAGGAFGDVSVSDPTAKISWDHGGFGGGLHAGYNHQFGQFIVGIEGDYGLSKADGTLVLADGVTVSTKTSNIGSIRGRLGLTVGSALVYATAGYGFGQLQARLVSVPDSIDFSESNRISGYVVGGGVEMKLMQSVSGRLEALHYGLGRKAADSTGIDARADIDQTVIRAGLTFHVQ